jgi:hypothetical protein
LWYGCREITRNTAKTTNSPDTNWETWNGEFIKIVATGKHRALKGRNRTAIIDRNEVDFKCRGYVA